MLYARPALAYRVRVNRSVRPLLNLLLALVLFAQGVSAAASGRGIERSTPANAVVAATAAAAAAMPMDHCQRMQAAAKSPPAAIAAPVMSAKASCCNAACPDMLSCAMASLAMPAHGALRLHHHLPPLLGAEPAQLSAQTRGKATFRPPILSQQA